MNPELLLCVVYMPVDVLRLMYGCRLPDFVVRSAVRVSHRAVRLVRPHPRHRPDLPVNHDDLHRRHGADLRVR